MLAGTSRRCQALLSWRRLVTEYELATAAGEMSLLLEVLAQTFMVMAGFAG